MPRVGRALEGRCGVSWLDEVGNEVTVLDAVLSSAARTVAVVKVVFKVCTFLLRARASSSGAGIRHHSRASVHSDSYSWFAHGRAPLARGYYASPRRESNPLCLGGSQACYRNTSRDGGRQLAHTVYTGWTMGPSAPYRFKGGSCRGSDAHLGRGDTCAVGRGVEPPSVLPLLA
jgi:hypothetical protein